MREIKFRTWDDEHKEMITVERVGMHPFDVQLDDDARLIVGRTDTDGDWHEVALMQYTGLKDKSGKDIYEGDILKDGEAISSVVFGQYDEYCSDAGFNIQFIGFYLKPINNSWLEGGFITRAKELGDYEIAGNIYENLNLIK